MTIFSLLCGLLGCQSAEKPALHQLSDITAVSISCGHMDSSCGYSFRAYKAERAWLLDAACFTHGYETEVQLKGCMLDTEEATELLEILQQGNSIAYAENYKKPQASPLGAADETVYAFCLSFSDGAQFVTYDRQSKAEEFFYRLAEKQETTTAG